jgi:hypothetical protein
MTRELMTTRVTNEVRHRRGHTRNGPGFSAHSLFPLSSSETGRRTGPEERPIPSWFDCTPALKLCLAHHSVRHDKLDALA